MPYAAQAAASRQTTKKEVTFKPYPVDQRLVRVARDIPSSPANFSYWLHRDVRLKIFDACRESFIKGLTDGALDHIGGEPINEDGISALLSGVADDKE